MKLIGVTGKSGAGKTTFSDYLTQKNIDIGIIHVDEINEELKEKYLKVFIKNNKTDRKKVSFKLNSFLYKNKHFFNIAMRIRSMLVSPLLNKRIKKMNNKKIVMIDDTFLIYDKVFKRLDKIYELKRAYQDRRAAIMERDDVTKEEAVAYDIAFFTSNYNDIKNDKRVIRIINDGDK